MAGRPTKLTPELQRKITDAIRAGNYMETAAAYAGIHKDTLYAWLKRGARDKSPKSPYRQFSDAVEKALAEAEVRDVALIAKAAEKEWQAAAWRLERKFPDRWGRKDRVQADIRHQGQVALEVTHDVSGHLTAYLDPIAQLVDDYLAQRSAADGAGEPVDSGDADAETGPVPGPSGA